MFEAEQEVRESPGRRTGDQTHRIVGALGGLKLSRNTKCTTTGGVETLSIQGEFQKLIIQLSRCNSLGLMVIRFFWLRDSPQHCGHSMDVSRRQGTKIETRNLPPERVAGRHVINVSIFSIMNS